MRGVVDNFDVLPDIGKVRESAQAPLRRKGDPLPFQPVLEFREECVSFVHLGDHQSCCSNLHRVGAHCHGREATALPGTLMTVSLVLDVVLYRFDCGLVRIITAMQPYRLHAILRLLWPSSAYI